jgi:hypothetical protein
MTEKPRKVKCEITMWSKPSHIATSQMQRFADLVEDLVISHNHQHGKKIDCVVDWPEEAE